MKLKLLFFLICTPFLLISQNQKYTSPDVSTENRIENSFCDFDFSFERNCGPAFTGKTFEKSKLSNNENTYCALIDYCFTPVITGPLASDPLGQISSISTIITNSAGEEITTRNGRFIFITFPTAETYTFSSEITLENGCSNSVVQQFDVLNEGDCDIPISCEFDVSFETRCSAFTSKIVEENKLSNNENTYCALIDYCFTPIITGPVTSDPLSSISSVTTIITNSAREEIKIVNGPFISITFPTAGIYTFSSEIILNNGCSNSVVQEINAIDDGDCAMSCDVTINDIIPFESQSDNLIENKNKVNLGPLDKLCVDNPYIFASSVSSENPFRFPSETEFKIANALEPELILFSKLLTPFSSNVEYTFSESGDYIISISANIGNGLCTDDYSEIFTVSDDANCTSCILNMTDIEFGGCLTFASSNTDKICVNDTFCFSNSVTVAFDELEPEYEIKIANTQDPETILAINTSSLYLEYTFTQAGSYIVTSTATKNNNCSETKQRVYVVPENCNESPISAFDFEKACDSYGFDKNFTYTGETEDATFLWDFGANATPQTSTEENPQGIIFTEADHTVSLDVVKNGITVSSSQTVTASDVGSSGNKKVIVCLKGKTKSINIKALKAHLKNGGCIGPCETQAGFENNTSVITNGDLKLYPNPTSNSLNINITSSNEYNSLKVIDISGRVILVKPLTNEETVKLDVSNLSKGMYYISIQSNDRQVLAKKFIKI